MKDLISWKRGLIFAPAEFSEIRWLFHLTPFLLIDMLLPSKRKVFFHEMPGL